MKTRVDRERQKENDGSFVRQGKVGAVVTIQLGGDTRISGAKAVSRREKSMGW